jgi:uncharacterized BrkB/YihY/UPF0761 family membrane protein
LVRRQLRQVHQTYGALAAVIILLLWLFLSAFVVLLGESPQRR